MWSHQTYKFKGAALIVVTFEIILPRKDAADISILYYSDAFFFFLLLIRQVYIPHGTCRGATNTLYTHTRIYIAFSCNMRPLE